MKYFAILSLVILNIGCATMSDVVKNKNAGTTKIYSVSESNAYKIARQVFRWEGSDTIEERKEENLLLTSSSAGLFTWGSFAGAWLEPIDSNNTKVTVVTKRKLATNVVTDLTEDSFHKKFAQAVEILNLGKLLPIEAP